MTRSTPSGSHLARGQRLHGHRVGHGVVALMCDRYIDFLDSQLVHQLLILGVHHLQIGLAVDVFDDFHLMERQLPAPDCFHGRLFDRPPGCDVLNLGGVIPHCDIVIELVRVQHLRQEPFGVGFVEHILYPRILHQVHPNAKHFHHYIFVSTTVIY